MSFNKSCVIYNPDNSQVKLRLFCFSPGGTGASLFRPWVNLFPPEIQICAIQLPGRESRLKEPLLTDITSVITMLNHSLLPYLEEYPFAFFGHSVGALIAFEFARKLYYEKKFFPLHLFLSAKIAPHLPPKEFLHQTSDENLIKKLSEFGGTPQTILDNLEVIQLFLPIFRADLTISETYIYQKKSPLHIPFNIFGGTEDNFAPYDGLLQWSQETNKDFAVNMFPGKHMFLKQKPKVLVDFIIKKLNLYY